jgi:hypothetical protein
MARSLDCHASYFSILESTFQLDLQEGIQIVVNPFFQKVGVYEHISFLANYLVVVLAWSRVEGYFNRAIKFLKNN